MVEKSNHVVYEINYHFVWCPKYRHSVLTGKVKDSVTKSFRETCEQYNYSISTFRVLPDHVHLFLSSHPKNSPSKIVRVLKSKSARKAWSNCESTLEEFYWEVVSGKSHITLVLLEEPLLVLLKIILKGQSMFNGIHPQSQALRHSA